MYTLKDMILSASWKHLLRLKVIYLYKLSFIYVDCQPNIDFYSRGELKDLIKKFKDDVEEGKLNDVSPLKVTTCMIEH